MLALLRLKFFFFINRNIRNKKGTGNAASFENIANNRNIVTKNNQTNLLRSKNVKKKNAAESEKKPASKSPRPAIQPIALMCIGFKPKNNEQISEMRNEYSKRFSIANKIKQVNK